MIRRCFISIVMLFSGFALYAQTTPELLLTPAGKSIFPKLNYTYSALEPSIDSLTMRIHYSRHFRSYYDNFLKAVAGTPFESKTVKQVFESISSAPAPVKNNAGGFYNHALYWEIMAPNSGGKPTGALAENIDKTFGSFDNFKKAFTGAAMSRFGSGWGWLIVKADKSLAITSTPNQDNPLMDNAEVKGTPILLIDVWEHAYYLKYQNKRADYVASFWNVINWKAVSNLYTKAID